MYEDLKKKRQATYLLWQYCKHGLCYIKRKYFFIKEKKTVIFLYLLAIYRLEIKECISYMKSSERPKKSKTIAIDVSVFIMKRWTLGL